jgi:corrinoid protein of di/trimethylamine methyltransferase
MSEILSALSTAIIRGEKDDIDQLTARALEAGLSPQEILDTGLMPGMDHVGVEFRAGRMFVPEVLRSARAMQTSMDRLRPLLIASGAKMAGKVLLGTVKGDMHDIGKNLVAMMCEGAGFEVMDLGKNVAPETFVQHVKEFEPQVIGMSALLTTTMPYMKVVIDTLEAKGLRQDYIVLVGGAPLNEEFGTAIGADAYCRDAAVAAEIATRLVKERRAAVA